MDQPLAIRTFVSIAESFSFGKAADQLEIPRSTASRLIQDLERMPGARAAGCAWVSAPRWRTSRRSRACRHSFVICAHRSCVERHGPPAHPAEPQDGRQHIVGYGSSQTGRPIDLRFERDDEEVMVRPRSGVAVNHGTAHLTALVAGLGIAQNFRHQVQRWLERGELALVFGAIDARA